MQIKEIRIAKGISQRKTALDLGLSPVVYGRYENGIRKPEPEMLATIAAYLGVTVDELIGVNDAPDTKKEPAVAGRPVDHFNERVALLSPENRARMDAYLDGLLAAQDAQAP